MNVDEVWKIVKDDLRVDLSDGTFSFISQSELTDLTESDGRIFARINAYSPWHQRFIEQRLWGQIQQALERATGKPCEIKFSASPNNPKPLSTSAPEFGPLFSHAEDDTISYRQAAQAIKLRIDFTFEQFAVSSTNEMAYAAAQAVSRNPGQAYHLLFLFGGVGVGKTHLMQAIGHRVLEKDPTTRIIYCSGEQFTNEIVEAIRDKTTAEFRKKYRSVKVLLIDDIQFIGGKDKVQEEFFHTFNAIHQEGGQIVMTSDKLPTEIEGLEDRLRSRFEGGLTIDIQRPSFELRAAIVLIKAKAWGIDISMEVAQLIAANIDDARLLEGFLKRLMVEAEAKKEPISMESAERVLRLMRADNVVSDADNQTMTRLNPQSVLAAISKVFSVKISELKGQRRQQEIITPRHLAMYILRTEGQVPLIRIGEIFGGRDHTTVMHATDKITQDLVVNARLRGSLTEVKKLLG